MYQYVLEEPMDLSSFLVECLKLVLYLGESERVGRYCLRGKGYCSLPFTLSSPGTATSIMTTSNNNNNKAFI